MTTAAPPPPEAAGDPSGDAGGDTHATAARLAAAEAARLAAEVRAQQERVARLQAETNARAADDARLVAESRVRELEAQLTALLDAQDVQDARDARAVASSTPDEQPEDDGSFSLFGGPESAETRSLVGDGSNSGVLPMALIGVAIVAGLAALLAFVNGRTGFGLVLLGVTLLLLWLASASWVTPVEIRVDHGVVHIDDGSTQHRFDLRNERTQVEMRGRPGDRDWEVRFVRRGLDPFVVRDDMVDASSFVRRLREWRPDL